MVAKTDPDFDQYEADIAEYFAAGKKEGASDVDRQRQSNKRMSLELKEEQQAAQRRREAQRDANREAQAAQRSAPSAPAAPQLSAPTLSVPGVSSLGVGTGGPDRATSARIIVVIVVISAIGTVAHDAIVGTTPASTTVQVGNGTVKVPTHLRTLGAVLVMGTIALVVNEFDPGVGLLLGVALGFDVAVTSLLGANGLFSRLQAGFGGVGKTTPLKPGPGGISPLQIAGPGYESLPPTQIGAGGLIGPQGVTQPQYHWNGANWVPVTSTTNP